VVRATPRGSAAGPGVLDVAREGAGGAAERAAERALALKEGIDTPPWFEDAKAGRCGRVPDWFKLVNRQTGECVDPRCRATNRCEYCRKMAAAETIEMLLLNAMSGNAPTLVLMLTARTFPTGDELRRTLRKIVQACRRRWPDFEWFVPRERQVRGELHVHPLVKGVPTDDDSMRALYDLVTRVWCARHDAQAYPFEERARGPQGLKRVADGEGLVRYLTKDLAHSLKSAQALELGFKGHRTSQTRGYFPEGAMAAREAARESLRRRRLAWKLAKEGLDAQAVADELDRTNDDEWFFHRLPSPARRVPANDGLAPLPSFMLAASEDWRAEREAIDEGLAAYRAWKGSLVARKLGEVLRPNDVTSGGD